MIPPESIDLGPVRLYYYSLFLLASVWIGYFVLLRQGKKEKIAEIFLTDAVIIALIAGVLGARIGYVLQNLSYFLETPTQIFILNSGGLSLHGALIGGTLGLLALAKRNDFNLLRLTDIFTIPLLLGQMIGRLGNYFNQELYGYPTGVSWKIFISPEKRLPGYEVFAYFHPVFLYEMLLHALGLWIITRLKLKKQGQMSGAYLITIGLARFITEIFRISERIIGPLSLAQMISIIIFFAGYSLIANQAFFARPSLEPVKKLLGFANHIFKKIKQTLPDFGKYRNRSRNKKN